MNLEPVCNLVDQISGADISIRHSTFSYETSPPAEDLYEAGIINETSVCQHTVNVKTCSGRTCASISFIELESEPVGYIQDIAVDDELRGNGIGSLLRATVVDWLEQRGNTIYSYPTNDVIRHIASKQGFQPTSNPFLQGWYVK